MVTLEKNEQYFSEIGVRSFVFVPYLLVLSSPGLLISHMFYYTVTFCIIKKGAVVYCLE